MATLKELLDVHDVYCVKYVTDEEMKNKTALEPSSKAVICEPNDLAAKAVIVLHEPNWTQEDEEKFQASQEYCDLD